MELISFVNNEPVVSSRLISEQTKNTHKAIIQLVSNYKADFEEFGRVAFEMEPFSTAGGVQERKICRLNEDQAALLMTYLRNNEVVRAFKKALIKAFKEVKKAPALPDFNNPVAAARAWADAKESEQKAIAALETAKPAIVFADTVKQSEHTYTQTNAGKKIQQRPRKFIQYLRDTGQITSAGLPYQKAINQGLMVVHTGTDSNGYEFTQGRVTTKGLEYYSAKLEGVKL